MTVNLFHGGPIVTMVEGDATSVECLVTIDDRISFVGDRADVESWAGERSVEITEQDLNGAALLPGFIDAHLHPLPMIFFAMSANLEGASTLMEVSDRLLKHGDQVKSSEWLVGVQYEGKKLPDSQKLTRSELDVIFPDRPVLIYARDGHCVIVNSFVLTQAGISEDTKTPDGGTIGRCADGRLDGLFHEKAAAIPLSFMPPPCTERAMAASHECFKTLARNGITSIGAMLQSDEEGPGGESARMESVLVQLIRDQIPQSIYSIVIGKTLEGIDALIKSSLNDVANNTRTRAFKIFADGTFGSCTACMSEPYADKSCTHGYMTLAEDEIYKRMKAAHLAGYQLCVHAIGDQGIENCVQLYERLLGEHPKADHRHRIEHASIASKSLIRRIAKLGLQVCTQPLFIRSEKDWLPARLGRVRTAQTYPFRDYVDAGIALAGSSDAPIEATDVIAAIDYAVNRGGFHPEQGLTPEEAVAMFTRNAAFIQFEEDEKGSLEVGKYADLIVLSRDPLTTPHDEIQDIQVLRTMIRGRFVSV
jgi:predicted amidohydrolase YtcJ